MTTKEGETKISIRPWLGQVLYLALADKQTELENEFHYRRKRDKYNTGLHWKLFCQISQVEELMSELEQYK